METFDHLIIGTGQATGTLLGKLIPTGDSIAVAEGAKVGGSCVNYGCTPTKALVASARAMHMARRGGEFGFSTGEVKVEYPRVRERMNAIRNASNQGFTDWMEGTDNVTLIRGWAAFESDEVVAVGDRRLQAERVYLNVGTRPFVPPIPGLDEVPWVDSAGLLDLDRLPRHLVVVGGGIATDERGFIEVDDVCRTAAAGVFAVGDVNGHGAFTHTAVNDAEIVLDHLFGGPRRLSSRIQIYALFTDPPLGRVGMSLKEALASDRRVLEATRPMKRISRAKEMSETAGFARLLVDAESDQILGATILGPGGDEIINMFAAIMHSQIPCHEYRRVVLVHPTVAELMPWILDGIAEARAQA